MVCCFSYKVVPFGANLRILSFHWLLVMRCCGITAIRTIGNLQCVTCESPARRDVEPMFLGSFGDDWDNG